ncbi:O-antigen translocase [Aeromonas veronii]|uniref:O-antigen translocase n=1 Tax=Aeromonas veronii TaxID=654 RepID=UPI003004069F
MKLLGTAFLGGLLTLLRMLTGFIVTKFVAVYVGPTGVALLGQLQSFVAGVNGLIANQIGQGIVRFTAEHRKNDYEITKAWWSAATSLLLITVIGVGVTIVLLSKPISLWLFENIEFYWLLIIVGFSLPLNAINSVLLGVLNGLGENKEYVYTSMISVCFTTLISIVFLYLFGLNGGLFAIAINNAVAAVIVIARVWRTPWFKCKYWFSQVDKKKRKVFIGYMLMGVIGAFTGPTALITIRNLITASISIEAAGIWQAVAKISDAYLGIFTIGIGMYYFPKAAAITSSTVLRKETKHVFVLITPFLIMAIACIFFLRDFIINFLYSDEFYSARDLFVPQLIGDLFRLLAFIPASILLAKGYFKLNATAEILMNLCFVLFSYILLQLNYGLVSINIAYAVIYVFYLVFSVFFFNYHCRQLNLIKEVS